VQQEVLLVFRTIERCRVATSKEKFPACEEVGRVSVAKVAQRKCERIG
jgi:hypothetical protein